MFVHVSIYNYTVTVITIIMKRLSFLPLCVVGYRIVEVLRSFVCDSEVVDRQVLPAAVHLAQEPDPRPVFYLAPLHCRRKWDVS